MTIQIPDMPVIRNTERWVSSRFPLTDDMPSVGWIWAADPGESVYAIIDRGRMGGLKTLATFPMTEAGWRAAWAALAEADPDAPERVRAALERRAAMPAEIGQMVDTRPMLIVTTNDLPGYRITEVHGDVFGLIVRARNYFSNLGASFRTLAGGEVAGYTKLLADSRNQARERMWREARAKGANAVVAMRFDCNEIGDIMSEVAAYGTAVTVEPAQPGPTVTASEVG